MKLTKESEILISFFIKNKCVNPLTQTDKTDKIFTHFFC